MSGNADITDRSASDEFEDVPFKANQTFEAMAAGNRFCINKKNASNESGCATLTSAGTPGISGLKSWTLKGIYDVREGKSNVGAIGTY